MSDTPHGEGHGLNGVQTSETIAALYSKLFSCKYSTSQVEAHFEAFNCEQVGLFGLIKLSRL
jgi:hypothetical protein